MANNRMFLIHKPSRIGAYIGKRMARGWYDPPEQEYIQKFYDYLEDNYFDSRDDLVLAMEDATDSTCFDGWNYTGERTDGFVTFDYES
ncbi:MAG: hypothetical protein JKY88_09015 [Pseudomonadales bacterium]|nr:hypothetical protein [Pseudomonadales bacterium]